MPERLIDANALKREVKTECNPYGKPTIGFDDGKKVLELIDAAPTIDAKPVRNGRWIFVGEETMHDGWAYRKYRCTECDFETVEAKNFCQNCGVKMNGGNYNG